MAAIFGVSVLLSLSSSNINGSSQIMFSKLIEESYTSSIEKLGSLTPNLRSKVIEGMHLSVSFKFSCY